MLPRTVSLITVAMTVLSSHRAAGAPWSPKDLGGNGLNSAPSSVYYDRDGTGAALFYRGLDNHLWVRWSRHSQPWGEPEDLGGILTSAPSAVSGGQWRIDVFYRGANNHLWTISRDVQGRWSKAADLGGVDLTSSPSAVMGANHCIDVFYRGPNNHLWMSWWDCRKWWSPATDLGGVELTCSPSAVSRASKTIDVFYCGPNRHLWTSRWYGRQWWSAPEEIGNDAITSDPSAIGSGKVMTVFYRGSNLNLWSISWKGVLVGPPGGPAGNWWSAGTQITEDDFPLDFEAISTGGILYRGANNHLWLLFQHWP